MAQAPANGTAKKASAPPPTKEEADSLSSQMHSLMNADIALGNVITRDVEMGLADNPFVHPLYSIRTKLDSFRGRKARRLTAYARSIKPKRVKK